MNIPSHMELVGTSTLLIKPIDRPDYIEKHERWKRDFDQKCRLATGKGMKELANQAKEEAELR
jgi:hypothetical protein